MEIEIELLSLHAEVRTEGKAKGLKAISCVAILDDFGADNTISMVIGSGKATPSWNFVSCRQFAEPIDRLLLKLVWARGGGRCQVWAR